MVITINQAADGTGGGGDEGDSESLKGSDYYVFMMDSESFEKISGKVKEDLRPDDDVIKMDIWEAGETYNAGTCVGPNSYGQMQDWVSLVVSTYGWAGGGFNALDNAETGNNFPGADYSGITADHVFHFAIKSQDSYSHVMYLVDGAKKETGFIIGSNGGIYPEKGFSVYGNFDRDGEWHEIEIPMKYFMDQGFNPAAPFVSGTNTVAWLSEPATGNKLEFDAMFIYKPAK